MGKTEVEFDTEDKVLFVLVVTGLSTNLKEQRTPNNQTIFNNDIWLNFHHFMAIWHCVNIGEKKWELFFPFSKIGPKMKLKLA